MLPLLLAQATFGEDAKSCALIVDAGSHSTEFHLYHWDEDVNTWDYQNYPSSIGIAPQEFEVDMIMSEYLDAETDNQALLYYMMHSTIQDYMRNNITCQDAADIPMYMYATGGMRTVDATTVANVVSALDTNMQNDCPFAWRGFTVLAGDEEALFLWLASNFVLERLVGQANEDTGSVGVVEQGGQTLQIAYMPRDEVILDAAFDLNFVGSNYRVYASSWNGMGNNGVHDSVKEILLERAMAKGETEEQTVHPCLPEGWMNNLTNEFDWEGQGMYNEADCNELMAEFFVNYTGTSGYCEYFSCDMGGNYKLPDPSGQDFYGYATLKYDIYGAQAVPGSGVTDMSPDLDTFYAAAVQYCGYSVDEAYANIADYNPKYNSLNCYNSMFHYDAFKNRMNGIGDQTVDYGGAKNSVTDTKADWTLGALLLMESHAAYVKQNSSAHVTEPNGLTKCNLGQFYCVCEDGKCQNATLGDPWRYVCNEPGACKGAMMTGHTMIACHATGACEGATVHDNAQIVCNEPSACEGMKLYNSSFLNCNGEVESCKGVSSYSDHKQDCQGDGVCVAATFHGGEVQCINDGACRGAYFIDDVEIDCRGEGSCHDMGADYSGVMTCHDQNSCPAIVEGSAIVRCQGNNTCPNIVAKNSAHVICEDVNACPSATLEDNSRVQCFYTGACPDITILDNATCSGDCPEEHGLYCNEHGVCECEDNKCQGQTMTGNWFYNCMSADACKDTIFTGRTQALCNAEDACMGAKLMDTAKVTCRAGRACTGMMVYNESSVDCFLEEEACLGVQTHTEGRSQVGCMSDGACVGATFNGGKVYCQQDGSCRSANFQDVDIECEEAGSCSDMGADYSGTLTCKKENSCPDQIQGTARANCYGNSSCAAVVATDMSTIVCYGVEGSCLNVHVEENAKAMCVTAEACPGVTVDESDGAECNGPCPEPNGVECTSQRVCMCADNKCQGKTMHGNWRYFCNGYHQCQGTVFTEETEAWCSFSGACDQVVAMDDAALRCSATNACTGAKAYNQSIVSCKDEDDACLGVNVYSDFEYGHYCYGDEAGSINPCNAATFHGPDAMVTCSDSGSCKGANFVDVEVICKHEGSCDDLGADYSGTLQCQSEYSCPATIEGTAWAYCNANMSCANVVAKNNARLLCNELGSCESATVQDHANAGCIMKGACPHLTVIPNGTCSGDCPENHGIPCNDQKWCTCSGDLCKGKTMIGEFTYMCSSAEACKGSIFTEFTKALCSFEGACDDIVVEDYAHAQCQVGRACAGAHVMEEANLMCYGEEDACLGVTYNSTEKAECLDDGSCKGATFRNGGLKCQGEGACRSANIDDVDVDCIYENACDNMGAAYNGTFRCQTSASCPDEIEGVMFARCEVEGSCENVVAKNMAVLYCTAAGSCKGATLQDHATANCVAIDSCTDLVVQDSATCTGHCPGKDLDLNCNEFGVCTCSAATCAGQTMNLGFRYICPDSGSCEGTTFEGEAVRVTCASRDACFNAIFNDNVEVHCTGERSCENGMFSDSTFAYCNNTMSCQGGQFSGDAQARCRADDACEVTVTDMGKLSCEVENGCKQADVSGSGLLICYHANACVGAKVHGTAFVNCPFENSCHQVQVAVTAECAGHCDEQIVPSQDPAGPPSASPATGGEDCGASAPAIAGLVIGIILLVVLLVVGVYMLMLKRDDDDESSAEAMEMQPTGANTTTQATA